MKKEISEDNVDNELLTINAREQIIGSITIKRTLPSRQCRMVGPFIFVDHMTPTKFSKGNGIDVLPHPHIGLATITYLFEGEIEHKDSLGTQAKIKPKTLNIMTAGKGIVHSERSAKVEQEFNYIHGLQCWLALPTEYEECPPSFEQYKENELPVIEQDGAEVTLLIGAAYGATSPVKTLSRVLTLCCQLNAAKSLNLPNDYQELAVYVVSGEVSIKNNSYQAGQLLVLDSKQQINIVAQQHCHFIVLGGSPVGKRYIDWNFVSSSKQRIEQAKQDWQAQNFDKISGETEFIKYG